MPLNSLWHHEVRMILNLHTHGWKWKVKLKGLNTRRWQEQLKEFSDIRDLCWSFLDWRALKITCHFWQQLQMGGRGYGSIMSTTALRVPSEVWLQSNRNIMLHFNGLSWFVPCRWEHCQPTFAKYVSTFLRDVFGESYKRFSLKSVCAELNSKEPLKGIWTSFLSFFFWLWQNIFFSFWFGCEELCSWEDLERLK